MNDDEEIQPPPCKKSKVWSQRWENILCLQEDIKAMWQPDITGWYRLYQHTVLPRHKAWYYSLYMRAQHLQNEELYQALHPDHEVYYPTNHWEVTDFEQAKEYALSLPSSHRLRIIFEVAMDQEGAEKHPDNKENIDPLNFVAAVET